jgi:hypothetical protein
MENSICNFKTIYSPNRRYANTVSIVFFKANPPSKNFQQYVDGLKSWKHLKNIFPDSQLQVFVDRHIAEDEELFEIMKDLDARVILFECPKYMKNGFHTGLFGTMIRFFPAFDINTHALNVAHICELEPIEQEKMRWPLLDYFSKRNTGVSMQYLITNIFARYAEFQPEFEGIPYPWIIAGRWSAFEKAPFSLMTDYLDKIDSGDKQFNRYTSELKADLFSERILTGHGNYSFGVDETFLNLVYLPWLIKAGHKIGLIMIYVITEPIYYNKEQILKDKRSKACFDFILQTNQSVYASIKEFLSIFYDPEKKKKELSEKKQKIVDRFYQVLEKYPTWLGNSLSKFLLDSFRGQYHSTCMIIVQNNKIMSIVR